MQKQSKRISMNHKTGLLASIAMIVLSIDGYLIGFPLFELLFIIGVVGFLMSLGLD